MKKLVAAAALMAVSSVNAEELKFGDLNYLLKSGEFQISADANHSVSRFKLGATTTEVEGYETTARATMGVMDNLNVFAELGYNYEFETKDETANTSEDSDGLRNPAVGGIFRLVEPANGGFTVDAGATARVRIEDAESDNAADPRHSLELFGRLGSKMNEANEFQLTAGVIHHFDGEQDDVDVDSSNDIFARAFYQWRPVNEFMLATGVQGTRVGEFDTDGVESEEHLEWDLLFNAKYLITSNFIARFNYNLGRTPDYDFGAAEVETIREQRFGFGVDFLF